MRAALPSLFVFVGVHHRSSLLPSIGRDHADARTDSHRLDAPNGLDGDCEPERAGCCCRARQGASGCGAVRSHARLCDKRLSMNFGALCMLTPAKGGLVVIDFHAVWCGPCKMIAPCVTDSPSPLTVPSKYQAWASQYSAATFLKCDVVRPRSRHGADRGRIKPRTSRRSTRSARCRRSSSCVQRIAADPDALQLRDGRQVEMVRGANPAACVPPSCPADRRQHRGRHPQTCWPRRLHVWAQLGLGRATGRRSGGSTTAAPSPGRLGYHEPRSADQSTLSCDGSTDTSRSFWLSARHISCSRISSRDQVQPAHQSPCACTIRSHRVICRCTCSATPRT